MYNYITLTKFSIPSKLCLSLSSTYKHVFFVMSCVANCLSLLDVTVSLLNYMLIYPYFDRFNLIKNCGKIEKLLKDDHQYHIVPYNNPLQSVNNP